MTIQFDDGAADTLVSAATSAAAVLRDQGGTRRAAAENAAADFSGAYARAFEAVCATEAQDRGRLAGVLDDLATEVENAKVAATTEKQRLSDLAAWEERDEVWKNTIDGMTDPWLGNPADPKPTEPPVAAPTVSAAFQAAQRSRTAMGSGAGDRSSADPAALRAFVSDSRTQNIALASETNRLGNAWVGFVGGCSWVQLGTTTFLDGFTLMLMENEADALWLETIAGAFELAGGGAVDDKTLEVLWEAKADPDAAKKKIDEMTPAQRKTLELFDSILEAASDQTHSPEDPLGLLAWALTHVANGGNATSEWFTHSVHGRLAPRINGRFAPYAATPLGRGLQAMDSKNWTAKPGSAGDWAKWSSAGKWAGRASGALGFVTGGLDQLEMDQGAGYEPDVQTARVTVRSVTAGGGGWAGAAGGAWAGAAIGSFAGPIGTIVGGIIGGIIGGIVGSGVGNYAADEFNDNVLNEKSFSGGS